MSHGLLIAAAQSHQPPLPHLAILGIVAIAVVGWLVYRAVTGRRSRARDSHSERGPGRTRSAAEAPKSDPGSEL